MVRVAKRNSSDAAGLVVVVVTVKRRVISRSSLDASSRLEVIQTPPSGPRWPRRYPWRLRLGSSRRTLVRTPQGHWRTGWTDRRQAQVSLACRPVPRQLPAAPGRGPMGQPTPCLALASAVRLRVQQGPPEHHTQRRHYPVRRPSAVSGGGFAPKRPFFSPGPAVQSLSNVASVKLPWAAFKSAASSS